MRKTILYLSGFMIISSLSVSCVSKKKFEELARAKREVDRNLLDLKRDKKQLEDQLQLAKDDFNTIRYKLTENNAVKDKTIDQLYTKLRSLESKQVELKSELSMLPIRSKLLLNLPASKYRHWKAVCKK